MRPLLVIFLLLLSISFACSDKKPTTPIKYPDQTPPAKITSLWICVENPTWADICWYAPGDDSLTGKATAYEIRFSQTGITDSSWDSCDIAVQTLVPRDPTVGERFRLIGLDSGTTYFAAIKAVDDVGNWSALSNVITVNEVELRKPAAIVDLHGEVTADSVIHLTWTTPLASSSATSPISYVLRYSVDPILEDNWNVADSIVLNIIPGDSDTQDSVAFPWPSADTLLYLTLMSRDVFEHSSDISNVIRVVAPAIIPGDVIELEWERLISTRTDLLPIRAVATADGGIAILSSTGSSLDSPHGIIVTKVDSAGTVEWEQSYGTVQDWPASILDPDNGELLIAGTTRSMGDLLGDPYLITIGPNGTLLSEHSIPLEGRQSITGASLAHDGTVLLAGGSDRSALTVSTDILGNLNWFQLIYAFNYCIVEGPIPIAIATAVAERPSGEIVTHAALYYAEGGHATCGPPYDAELMLQVYDAEGQAVDYVPYAIDRGDAYGWAGDLLVRPNGSLLTAGYVASNGVGPFVSAISISNNVSWTQPLNGFRLQTYEDPGLTLLPILNSEDIIVIGNKNETEPSGNSDHTNICLRLLSSNGTPFAEYSLGAVSIDDRYYAAATLTDRTCMLVYRDGADNRLHLAKLHLPTAR